LRSIELTIRNDPAEMSVVRDALDRFGAEHRIPADALIELQVVVDEIVSNVIKYAWPEGGAHELRVRVAVGDAGAEVEVVDDGRRYDPRDAPVPGPAGRGGKPRIGGRGIHMVMQLVDRFEYERVDDRNHVRLTKQFIVEAPAERGPDDKRRA
jgi:serine/threonine-protein kinase RsbW